MFNKAFALIIFLTVAALITPLAIYAQANIGFENGTFDNWEFAVGTIQVDGSIRTSPSAALPNAFTLIKNDKALQDEYGRFPLVSPNGSGYSAILGNRLYGNTVQQMSYTLTVPASGSKSILFDYAVVLVNPGHEAYQQPRFTVKVYNVTDDKYLDCPSFDFIYSPNLPGFKITQDSIFYKDWATASVNLTNLKNKTVRLEFSVNHCPFGQHFGYAYIDVSENISTPIKGNSICTDQSTITLSGPPGFASYTWLTPDFQQTLGTGQFLTLVPPPNLNRVAVKVAPYNGVGCPDTLYADITNINSPLKLVTRQTITGCPGSTIDLTLPEVTAGSSPGLAFEYLTDSLQIISAPFNITKSGTYYIRATNAGGCSSLSAVKVMLELPVLGITDPPPAVYPLTIDLAATFTSLPGVSYGYYADEQATKELSNFREVQVSGVYYIKAETAAGCFNIKPVTVNILPPEPFTVTAPNAFTPNNDGFNDRFRVSLDGFVALKTLQIYNRNGVLIFSTTDANNYWDGNYKGRALPTGTYYWMTALYDQYYKTEIKKASFITLIR